MNRSTRSLALLFLPLALLAADPLETQLANARALVKGGKAAEAKALLRGTVESNPKSREARKALLEAAALTKDWETCNAQGAALEPFPDGEEPAMFYAAVALRETGSVASARALLKRARPLLARNAWVDYYTKEILGD